MNVLKRILLFLVCFLVIAFAAFLITGAIVGAVAIRDGGDASHASEIGESAARAFGLHYSLTIWLGALIFSAAIAFRWVGALIAGILAAAVYLFTGGTMPSHEPSAQNMQPSASSPAAATPATLVGRHMSLAIPITIDLPYGKAQIPAGTTVQVLSETGDAVRIRMWGGQTTVIPRTNLK